MDVVKLVLLRMIGMLVDSKGVWELVVGWEQEARACTLREILWRAWTCYRLADQLDRVGLLTEALRTPPSVAILPRLNFINLAERLLDAQAVVDYMSAHNACPAQPPRESFYDGPPTQHGVVSIES